MRTARERSRLGALVTLAWLPLACGGAPSALVAPRGDEAVPASEPRSDLKLVVSLPRSSGCEEAFDLELYRDRGVDLVQWDEGEGCDARNVTIRYVPGRVSHDALLTLVQKLAAPAGVREQK